jgi:hypothetical protein
MSVSVYSKGKEASMKVLDPPVIRTCEFLYSTGLLGDNLPFSKTIMSRIQNLGLSPESQETFQFIEGPHI